MNNPAWQHIIYIYLHIVVLAYTWFRVYILKGVIINVHLYFYGYVYLVYVSFIDC